MLLIILLYYFSNVNNQFDACNFLDSYSNSISYKSKREIDLEYKKIFKKDQKYRGTNEKQIEDLKNLLKIAVLLSECGPPLNTIDNEVFMAPILVSIHNSYYAKYIFKYMIKYYNEGLIDPDQMQDYLRVTIFGSVNYHSYSTKGFNTKNENLIMIKDLDILNTASYSVKELCDAINANMSFESNNHYEEVYSWNKRATHYRILENSLGDFFIAEKFNLDRIKYFKLIKIEDFTFQYDNHLNPIEYRIQENGFIEVCDSLRMDLNYFKLL